MPVSAVVEVPLTTWHDVKGSKLSPVAMARSLLDLGRIGFDVAAASPGEPIVMNRGALAERLRRTYLQIDLRSLALGRIVLGLVLIGDLLRRVPYLRDLYSNLGLIPNHTVLWRPPFPRIFSVFFMASLPEEAALWFFIAFVCFFCFLIGYRTRLFHLLSFAMTTSLHNRVLAAENWGAWPSAC